MRPICHLQPITSNELAEPNGFARDDKSQTSRQWHQSANRRRLPVIVVFHSRQAGGASQSNHDDDHHLQQEENRRDDRQTHQNETRVVNNYDGGGQEEAQPQSESSHGAFVTANNTRSKWPLPQSRTSQPNKANSLLHLELARRTKSIVITFNYRIGLLGKCRCRSSRFHFKGISLAQLLCSASRFSFQGTTAWKQLVQPHPNKTLFAKLSSAAAATL